MARRKDYTVPALFVTAIVLVFVFLVVSLIFGNKKYPSVKNGATTKEVEDYAYSLLNKDDGTSALGYNEAIAYYTSQISESKDKEQRFNLMLDFAIFYGKTGDPYAGLKVLNETDTDIPLDAKYYLYATYIYLYERLNDDAMVADYRQRIINEGIDAYFAGLDDGTITPEDHKTDEENSEENLETYNEGGDSEEETPSNQPFENGGL